MGSEEEDASVLEDQPPIGQPSRYCQWRPNEDGTAIVWDQGEKFYGYVEWLEYLITHFLSRWGYVLNGEMKWQGERPEDTGIITVKYNQVLTNPSW